VSGYQQETGRPQSHRAATSARLRLPVSLIVIGAVLVLGALATLSQQWAWSWQTRGGTFTLSRMHAVCTSSLGELAQGVSGNVAGHCTRIDATWTAAIVVIAIGVLVGAIGLGRLWSALRAAR
jgi:hypothetical protein